MVQRFVAEPAMAIVNRRPRVRVVTNATILRGAEVPRILPRGYRSVVT